MGVFSVNPQAKSKLNAKTDLLATAIPHITADFHRLDEVPWYGSAYLLTEMSFQPAFGRLYSLFDAKILYLISILICKYPRNCDESVAVANRVLS